jgi:hypothetical protein
LRQRYRNRNTSTSKKLLESLQLMLGTTTKILEQLVEGHTLNTLLLTISVGLGIAHILLL